MDTVKDIMIIEEVGGYTFAGKTGTGARVVPHVGWFVGYLETADNVYIFATNIELQSIEGNLGKAREITENILHDLELKP
jgi:beta-lactamase class D